MSATTFDDDTPVRARIPADLDTPDQLVAGLSARQVAVLAVAAVPLYALWQGLSERLPGTALLAITAALAAPAIALALGRRDGLGLDQWLLAALRFRRGPRELAPGPSGAAPATPAWASARTGPGRRAGTPVRPAVLNLPATAIAADGTISAANGSEVVLVAASTVTTGLHTDTENRALMAGYARWLNSLTGPVQVLVSSRRVDLGSRALRVAEAGARLPHPALARAALEHAEFLLDLDEDGDRLARTVTIACTGSPPRTTAGAPTTSTRTAPGPWPAPTGQARVRPGGGRDRLRRGGTGEAAQRAARAAAALGALGSRCRVLTGAQVTSVLTTAAAPFAPGSSTWERTPPLETVTGPAAAISGGQPPGIPGADEDGAHFFEHGQQEQW